MREDNTLFEEELQQEEEIPVVQEVGKLPQEEATEIAPETESLELAGENEEQPQEIPAQNPEATEQQPEMPEQISETTEQPQTPADNTKAMPYHERYYLKYREGKRSAALDLDGTKAFLQGLGFDGGELRQARAGKNVAETFRNADSNKNNQMYCSYCGSQISGVEFYRLPDGRMRCTTCSSTVVKTKAEVEEICQRVIANMDNFFGATIDVPVTVEVMDERKLKKKVGVPLGTKDSQSMLILGVAINKKKKYSIILENGAPRMSLIATFAHELTHIWQYTHWDNKKNFKKCPKSKRLLIYEGMAKWVEIQYLYLIGETNVAKREEYITSNRQDPYGIGFCLYADRYPLSREAMSCDDTPFMPDCYPFDS